MEKYINRIEDDVIRNALLHAYKEKRIEASWIPPTGKKIEDAIFPQGEYLDIDAFYWDATPQGFDFWDGICEKYGKTLIKLRKDHLSGQFFN